MKKFGLYKKEKLCSSRAVEILFGPGGAEFSNLSYPLRAVAFGIMPEYSLCCGGYPGGSVFSEKDVADRRFDPYVIIVELGGLYEFLFSQVEDGEPLVASHPYLLVVVFRHAVYHLPERRHGWITPYCDVPAVVAMQSVIGAEPHAAQIVLDYAVDCVRRQTIVNGDMTHIPIMRQHGATGANGYKYVNTKGVPYGVKMCAR